jgi:hypothetical protein
MKDENIAKLLVTPGAYWDLGGRPSTFVLISEKNRAGGEKVCKVGIHRSNLSG